MVLNGEEIPVDAFGFRDRSWGHRAQFGEQLPGGFAHHGGYSYATASEADACHTITMDWGDLPVDPRLPARGRDVPQPA